jgi:hypothetical protein
MPIEGTAFGFPLITFGLAGAAHDRQATHSGAASVLQQAHRRLSAVCGLAVDNQLSGWQGCDDGVGVLLGTRQPGPGAQTSLLLGYE